MSDVIRTVADLLQAFATAEVARLDAVDIKHGPTIGAMYEGLSRDLLGRGIPEALDLQITHGFVHDGRGNQSGQIDCMLVRGEGEEIPYTDGFRWHVKDLISVFEVKKTLYHDDLVDAYEKLKAVNDLAVSYRAPLSGGEAPSISSARRAFGETTGVVAPDYDQLASYSVNHQLIFHTMVSELLNPVGIVLGYHGYATEKAFRESLLDHLRDHVNTMGYGPLSLPQLMISGAFSLGKANGQPYSARLNDDWWPYYFSSRVSPILLVLEYIWTRLDWMYGLGDLWGDDLMVERHSPYLLAKGVATDERWGWELTWADLTEDELALGEDVQPWEPAFLSAQQFVVISKLCAGEQVFLDDPEFVRYLDDAGLEVETFRQSLLDTMLVAIHGNEIQLITEKCLPAILPDEGFAAGEDNSGRMSRWIGHRLAADTPPPPEAQT